MGEGNIQSYKHINYRHCGGGQVVSVFVFYSNNLSSNPVEAYSFSVRDVFEKNENKQKRPGGHI